MQQYIAGSVSEAVGSRGPCRASTSNAASAGMLRLENCALSPTLNSTAPPAGTSATGLSVAKALLILHRRAMRASNIAWTVRVVVRRSPKKKAPAAAPTPIDQEQKKQHRSGWSRQRNCHHPAQLLRQSYRVARCGGAVPADQARQRHHHQPSSKVPSLKPPSGALLLAAS